MSETETSSSTSGNRSQSKDSIKIIVLGDSAVGKSKLLERFLVKNFEDSRYSTYAVNIFKHTTKIDNKPVEVEFWDTAGQEKFDNLHQSYFHQAHACIMIFDATRKITYKNLDRWYTELRDVRPHIPCLLAVNKIDAAMEVTKKAFSFPKKHDMPLYCVSAANGTNVVRLFRDAIRVANAYRTGETADFIDQIMRELEDQRSYDDISQTVDLPSHHYENHSSDLALSSERSSDVILDASHSTFSACFGARGKLASCLLNLSQERQRKKHKFWLNLLLAEEWNYFYLLKDKAQPFGEQENHIKRLTSATKLAAILVIYLNSLIPWKSPSSSHRTLCVNHYERLHYLFNSLLEVIASENEQQLCASILQRLVFLIKKMKEQQYESTFIQFPSYQQRTLSLSSADNYRCLHVLSKDKQTLVDKLQLHLILGVNVQPDKHLLVLSVEQPQGSNAIHNFHFAHADRSIIHEWFQLLDNYVRQAKRDYMNKYHEYRI